MTDFESPLVSLEIPIDAAHEILDRNEIDGDDFDEILEYLADEWESEEKFVDDNRETIEYMVVQGYALVTARLYDMSDEELAQGLRQLADRYR